jgi:hypothetical protein
MIRAVGADLERRLILARAFADEHGLPLGFHDERDQLDWDRKACEVLRLLDKAEKQPEIPRKDAK